MNEFMTFLVMKCNCKAFKYFLKTFCLPISAKWKIMNNANDIIGAIQCSIGFLELLSLADT